MFNLYKKAPRCLHLSTIDILNLFYDKVYTLLVLLDKHGMNHILDFSIVSLTHNPCYDFDMS